MTNKQYKIGQISVIIVFINIVISMILVTIFNKQDIQQQHLNATKTKNIVLLNELNNKYMFVFDKMKIIYGNDGKYRKQSRHLVIKQPYKISKHCIELIKKWESCSLTAYHYSGNNVEKHATIGWGHVIYEGDKTPSKITQKQADDMLIKDLNDIFVPAANKLLNDVNKNFRVTQGFFDGFVSLLYNCGITGIQKSAFWRRLKLCRFDDNGNINKADYEYMLAAIKTARVSEPGHVNRRSEEYKLMRNNLNK